MSVGKIIDIIVSPISLIVGDKIGHAITGAVLAVAGIVTGNVGLIALGASMVLQGLAPKPKTNTANVSRLQVSLDPTTPRKIVFGHTAMATDMVYGAYTGTGQDHYDQIVCVAAHQVQSIDEIWFDNQQAWTSGGGVTSAYSGYLTVETRTVGTRSNGIAIDSTWTANSTLTGCAYIHLRYKLTGNSSKATSPFSSSIPSRFTVRGKGALVYDPRLDSTVPGGSGPQRANDQTTWAWDDNAARNPALQDLYYHLGWRIQNPATSAWKLSVGRGIPPARLDLPSYITAANVADETIALAAGGTEPRYRSDGVFSEGDDPSTAFSNLLGAMNATHRDAGGKIALICYTNDLGTPAASFTEADILGNESWQQAPAFSQIFNVVRGRYTNPSDTTLYQLADYPEVSIPSPDGIDRLDPVDYSNVQSASQAQRLAKQRLQRSQYQGKYTADFGARGWQVSLGQIVQLSHASLGWTNKPFRVTGQTIATTGVTRMVLVEENAAIYAWEAEDSAPVTPGAPTIYNPLNNAIVQGIVANIIYTGYLTNEADDVAAANDGTVSSFAGLGGNFIVLKNTTDVTSSATFSVAASSGVTVSIDSTGAYTVSAMSADHGSATLRATVDGQTIDKVYSIAKSKGGAAAKTIYITADRYTVRYDGTGALSPSSQTTTFTALKQNTTGTVTWTVVDFAGNTLTASSYLSATSGDSVTMTAAQFDAAIAVHSSTGVTVTGTIAADGNSDKSSIAKVVNGGDGSGTVTLYLRQYAPPSTPTGDNPSGWTASIPSGTETVWKVVGTKQSGQLVGVWSAPVVETQGLARAYDGSTTWYLGNVSLFNGGTYEALQNGFSAQAPSGTAAATAYWGVRAAPGAAGAPGTPPSGFTGTFNLSSGAAVNLRSIADANGYTGASDATCTFNVPSGVICRGLSGGGIGIDTGTWPSGYTIALTLVVQSGGIVDGGGGVGGDASLGAGGAGGDAIYCRVDMSGGVTINSGGIVRGGGGGGGGGSGALVTPPGQISSPDDPYNGGGGGGGGAPNGAGGAGEAGANSGTDGSDGSAGTTSGGGAGGSGWQSGGNGGGFATAGTSGTGRGGAGAAGFAVRKNGHTVTVTNNGTMTGSAA